MPEPEEGFCFLISLPIQRSSGKCKQKHAPLFREDSSIGFLSKERTVGNQKSNSTNLFICTSKRKRFLSLLGVALFSHTSIAGGLLYRLITLTISLFS